MLLPFFTSRIYHQWLYQQTRNAFSTGIGINNFIHTLMSCSNIIFRKLMTYYLLRGYCTSGPYFWRFCAFSQKIKQLRTKYPMDLVRNVPRNSKITILLQCRPLLWSYSEKCAKINIFHVLSHKSITTWVSETPVQ